MAVLGVLPVTINTDNIVIVNNSSTPTSVFTPDAGYAKKQDYIKVLISSLKR